jgi:ABC-2 type transport system permease protein
VFSGILFWNFFNQSVVTSMNSLKGNASLLQKLPVPKAVFPIATVLSGVVNLIFALVPLSLILFGTNHRLSASLLFLPVGIIVATMFTLGAGLILSPLAVFFNDVIEMVTVVLTLILYLTPVFYPLSIVPLRFRWVVECNPLQLILEIFRAPIYRSQIPEIGQLSVAVLVATAMLVGGVAVFERSSDRIPFYL